MVVAGLFIYLFMGWCSFKHINGEEERTNKCVICLVAGRKREKERKRKREIKIIEKVKKIIFK